MLSWVNYHSHTCYCDGTDLPVNYIQQAINNKLPAYGFSSHAPINFPTNWCIADENINKYISDIQDIKNAFNRQIEVYAGLEIDFIPGFAGRSEHIIRDIPLDYFIGSVHFVDAFSDGTFWNIDNCVELFEKGLVEIFHNDMRKAATRFYEITRQMIVEDKPDIIGHLDKIKMYNNKGKYFNESEQWYHEQIDRTMHVIKENNTIVEINTRGLYRYGQSDLYPSEWIIKKLAEADVPLMINSDAHKPEEIIMGMPFAAKKLLEVGVESIYALHQGEWKAFSFDEDGICWT